MAQHFSIGLGEFCSEWFGQYGDTKRFGLDGPAKVVRPRRASMHRSIVVGKLLSFGQEWFDTSVQCIWLGAR